MKYFANKAFPHPVLSPLTDDYIDRRFQPAFKWEFADNAPKMRVKFALSEEYLRALIEAKKATYAVEIHCSQTFRRIVRRSFRHEEVFSFELGDFIGDVVVNFYIVAVQNIESWGSPNFHPDFGKRGHNISAGDVLSIYPPEGFWFDTENHKPIGTFFYLDSDEGIGKGLFDLDLEDEGKIKILVHPDDHQRISIARGQVEMKRWLMSSLYFPALLEVLHAMRRAPDEHESKKWCRAIAYKLESLDPPVNVRQETANLLVAAQNLFGRPLGRLPLAGEN